MKTKYDFLLYFQSEIGKINQGLLDHAEGGECFCTECCIAPIRIKRLQEAMDKVCLAIIDENYPPGAAAQ